MPDAISIVEPWKIGDGSPDEVRASAQVREIYLGAAEGAR